MDVWKTPGYGCYRLASDGFVVYGEVVYVVGMAVLGEDIAYANMAITDLRQLHRLREYGSHRLQHIGHKSQTWATRGQTCVKRGQVLRGV